MARKRWSLYPSLHDDVSSLLEDAGLSLSFHEADDEYSTRFHDTNIMGKFVCHNRSCPVSGWSSKVIAITIRLYEHDEYNARVYHQRCRRCNTLSKPKLDDSYADRIVYRLKKWHGIEQERRPHSGNSNGPHESALCEGCKAGHCVRGPKTITTKIHS